MPGFTEIPPDTVHRWVCDGEALLVDVREAEELAQACFADALHEPMSAFDPGRIPTESGKKVVFICAQGLRSAQVGQYMVAEGLLAEAYNLSGGIMAWAEAGLPFETGA